MLRVKNLSALGLALALGLTSAGTSRADLLSFSGSSGSLSAQADFSLVGSTLTVTLTNTSQSDVLVPTDVLHAVFFNTSHTLTPVSASLNGSTVYYGSIANNVGEGWQYAIPANGPVQGKNAGISAAGLGKFGPYGNFYNGTTVKLGGLNYGILSAG